jgi:hypothetical protein
MRALLGLAALPIAMLLLFTLGLAFGVHGTDVWILGTALLTAGIALAPLLLDRGLSPERRNIFLSLLCVTFGVFFVGPVFGQYFFFEGVPIGVTHLAIQSPRDILNAQLTALLGLACMLAGYALPLGSLGAAALPRPTYEWSLGAALGVALVMVPLGWSIFLAGQFGLVPRQLGSGVLGTLASWYYFGIALLTITYRRYRAKPALLLILVFIPPAMLFSFFTGSKTLLLSPLLMVALTHIVMTRSVPLRWVFAGVAVIVFIYPVAQFYREVIQAGNKLGAVQVLRDPIGALTLLGSFVSSFDAATYLRAGLEATSQRLDALGVLTVIVRETPERVPFQGGWTIGYIFLSYVPRVLWPGKPVTSIGQWVTDAYTALPGTIQSHTGPSWIGELYFNFGHLGVGVGMALFGIYFRFLQSYVLRSDATIPALFIGVVVLAATAPTIGGSLAGPIAGVSYHAGALLLVHSFVRLLSPPGRLPAPAPARERSPASLPARGG